MNLLKEDNRTKDIQALSMSISKNGVLGLFCGAYNILLLSLDDFKTKRKLAINKSSEPIFCQWNKLSNEMFAITTNSSCKVYNTELIKLQSLKAHNKCVSSIDWHPISVNQLATSSLDCTKSLCIWDIRTPKSPMQRVDTNGINQVKWNKVKSHFFATSFNWEIRLWDDRKLSSPINLLSAHSGVINDFDWHPADQNVLLSCGQDKKTKIWNFLEGFLKPIVEYEEDVSFSRSRFDNLGNIMTLTGSEVPGENQVAYWDFMDLHKFCFTPSSSNIITTFDWKFSPNDTCDVVTLHRNSDFKIWKIDSATCFARRRRGKSYKMNSDNSAPRDRFYLSPSPDHSFNATKAIPVLQSEIYGMLYKNDTLSSIMSHHSDPNLIMRDRQNKFVLDDQEMRHREFDKLINTNQITFEKNYDTRSVIAHFTLINIKCSVQFIYRSSLGDTVFLDVNVLPGRAEKIRQQNLDDLEKILKGTADDCRGSNALPIEKCIDVAMDFLNKLSSRFSLRCIRSLKEQTNSINSYCNLPDVKVPFPRICGATFSPSGILVCFISPPTYMNRFHSTPRSMADIAKYSNNSSSSKGFYYDINTLTNKNTSQKQFHKTGVRKMKTTDFNLDTNGRKLSTQSNSKFNHYVILYNVLQLSLFSPSLAKKYSIDISEIDRMCQTNCNTVADSNRKDLIEFWQYSVILANGCKSSYNLFASQIKPWPSQLMGRRLCEMWLDHFTKCNDIQSAAMLILVMRGIDNDLDTYLENRLLLSTNRPRNVSQESLIDNVHSENVMAHFQMQSFSSYHPAVMLDVGSRNTLPVPSRFRNNSNSEIERQHNNKKIDSFPECLLNHNENSKLINPSKVTQYNRILLHYVTMLTAQNLLSLAAKIIQKIMPSSFSNHISGYYNFSILLLKNCPQDHKCRSVYIDESRSTIICTDCPSINHSIPKPDLNIKTPIICSICRLYVRGLLSMCTQCNHGGHIDHITTWFSRPGITSVCPTGCGCVCILSKDILHDLSMPMVAN